MSLPNIKVEIGFQTDLAIGASFRLDSATLGVLDVGTLGGVTFVDVTTQVLDINIDRGRSDQLGFFTSGTASLTLNNSNRYFDPLNTSSPYYPGVLPRASVRIYAENIQIYGGLIVDWDLSYDIANQDRVTARCTDSFTVLSNQSLSQFTPAVELSSTRINNILDRNEVNYAGGRSVETGIVSLGAYQVSAGTNVLSYLHQIEASERGYLFIAADGVLTFIRQQVNPGTPVLEFNDTGTGIPYSALSNQFGDELLYNRVVASAPGLTTVASENDESINLYQISELNLSDLLCANQTDLQALADAYLFLYRFPVVRFTGLAVNMQNLSDTQKAAVLALDLTDYVDVVKTFNSGAPTSRTQLSLVTGIRHTIRPEAHLVELSFDPVDETIRFQLDSASFGVLNTNQLG